MCTNSRGNTNLFHRAFSLVEMLLVIAITGILIALLLPALTGARDTALRVSTASMGADLTNAAQRFENDNAGRSPGYFSQKEMGHSENEEVGMSAMENAMIFNDLYPAACATSEHLDEIRKDLEDRLGRAVHMSGSGSTLFVLGRVDESDVDEVSAECRVVPTRLL